MLYYTFYDIFHSHSEIGSRVLTYKSEKFPSGTSTLRASKRQRAIHKTLRNSVIHKALRKLTVDKLAGNLEMDARPYETRNEYPRHDFTKFRYTHIPSTNTHHFFQALALPK